MNYAVLAGLIVVMGCADVAPIPAPGTLVVELVATSPDAGALVFTVSGGPVTRVVAPGYEVTSRSDASGTHILVSGTLRTGTLVRLDVPELSRAGAYAVTVDQVADGVTFALLDPDPTILRLAEAR